MKPSFENGITSPSKKTLDLDFYEHIIAYNCLVDPVFLSSVIDHLDVKFFKNIDTKNIVRIIVSFFKEHGTVPTHTELKAYLTTD